MSKTLQRKWDKILQQEGLGVIDHRNRGEKAYASKTNFSTKHLGQGPENLEYYSLFRAYLEHFNYRVPATRNMDFQTLKDWKFIMGMYLEGQSIIEAYSKVPNLEKRKKINSQVYFYKRFQEAKADFLAVSGSFANYQEYVKYTHDLEPLSYFQWLRLHN